jgi:hypothetical protein
MGNGLYAYRESTIYFFHNNRLFSIRSIAPPVNPTSAWRAHPYYPYLEQSVPITEAIPRSQSEFENVKYNYEKNPKSFRSFPKAKGMKLAS